MENKREHPRHISPDLVVVINSSIFRVLSWSYGGFLIDAGHHKFNVGGLLTIEGIGEKSDDFPTNIVAVNVPSRIVHHDENIGVGISCLQMDDSTLSLLQRHEARL
ncbi:MAG: hypothetical protein HON65_16465 [Rhodospirillales bacterium]|jgi:hypothetical protein|nr:hypothetical protein [Rhodospirillales bacterium]